MKIARNHLTVQNATELATFYCDLLGMRDLGSNEGSAYGYASRQCLLEFHEKSVTPYVSTREDLYWKIGITVQDLDHAVAYLRERNWPVSTPHQFRDIGYLCHLQDPQGFNVELLQQGFQGAHRPAPAGHPIGAQATLAHITLRVTDLAAARSYCEDDLGMRLMSVQPVIEYGFCLYFYGWSDEPLPHADLEAVENREWLWARPYTLLELQHLETAERGVRKQDGSVAGFSGIAVGPADDETNAYPLKQPAVFDVSRFR